MFFHPLERRHVCVGECRPLEVLPYLYHWTPVVLGVSRPF